MKRGHIYKFVDSKAVTQVKYVLVVGNDSRKNDTLISALLLGDGDLGHDVVEIQLPEIGKKYVHCGLVTYISRHKLTDDLGVIPEDVMCAVEKSIIYELGLDNMFNEGEFYKKAYNNLVNKITEH